MQSEYLAAYLNSRFGQDHITPHATGMVQQGLPLKKVREIPIPRFGRGFESRVADVVRLALSSRRTAKECTAASETVLTTTLGLADWHPPQPLSYTPRASQAFTAGRLDSEYFEPEYAALRKHIRSRGGARLGDSVTEAIRRGISPVYVEDGDLAVINSQHVGKDHIVFEDTRTTLDSLVPMGKSTRTRRVRQWDVLLNSTGRITIGRCQCVADDLEAVVDNHVSIIRPRSGLDPVYLASFLNSRFGLMLTEQSQTGSSGQIEMRPELIEDFDIWIAPAEVQAAIRAGVLNAHAARNRSRELLAAAQRAVEIAIEQDEAAALVYLNGFDVAT